MALKFIENFFPYGVVGSQLAAANANFNTQWIVHGTVPALISNGFRANAKSITLSRTTTGFARVERRFETTDNVAIIGYAFRATQRGATTFTIENGEDVLLALEWPNQFQIGSDVGTATILLNKVYFVAIKITKSTGAVEVQVNGYPYLTTTIASPVPDLLQAYWGYNAQGPAADMTFSDVYFIDGTAGKFSDFMGPHRVVSRVVDAAVGTGWDPEPEDKDRVDIVTNIPPLVNEYTESDTVGTKDFYTSSAEVEVGAVINGVSVTSLLTKTDIDDQFVALAVSDGALDKLGTDISVPIQPAYFQTVFETDVEDADWTKATVEAAEFGPVIRPRP